MNHIEAMKQALEALESGDGWRQSDAINAIKQALAASVQEPAGMTFDEAYASLSWPEWRMRPIKELLSELHRLTTPPAAPVQEPYGQVTVVKKPGCVDMHWFYRWPEPPYLDNAAECHTLYTNPPNVATPLAAPVQEPVAITERMAFAFHNAITDGALGTDDLMDIMRGLEAAFAHITTPPAAQPAPVLVRDAAEVLGCNVSDVSAALVRLGYPPRSTNMAISGEELLAFAAEIKAAAPVQEPEWKQIAEDLRFHGLTLVKTATGYAVLKLGAVQSQAVPPAASVQEPEIPDCGEAGHAEGCCGNRECLPSFRRTKSAAQPAQLPTDMPRDEMLQYYSDYANFVVTEALRYQKRIKELENAAQRQWVGLTDEEIEDIHCTPPRVRPRGKFPFARMIEAKLKEKNSYEI